METFAEEKPLVDNHNFGRERSEALKRLTLADIDPPITDIVETFAGLPCCYTLQSCWGHFVHEGKPEKYNLETLADYRERTEVEYRLAYVAICIENSRAGPEADRGPEIPGRDRPRTYSVRQSRLVLEAEG